MPVTLSPRARAHLKSLAHALDPVVQVGTSGLTEEIVRATQIALEDHELIKVKLGKAFVGDRKEAARELAERTDAALAQTIGKVVVLYRPRGREDARRPRIKLPA